MTPSLGAHLLTQKFCYHSTFYREEWKLRAAHGIELTRNLMCSWHDHLADRLRPLKILPRRALGQALAYATKQLPHLEACFMDIECTY